MMPKIMFGLVLVAFLALAACVGIRAPLLRGVTTETTNNGMLSSNARPAMAVEPAKGFHPVVHGVTDAPVSLDGSAVGRSSARVWYALHEKQGGKVQLVADLAELNGTGWVWAINPLSTDRRGVRVLRETEFDRFGVSWTSLTYVRPAAKDPWMPAFAASGSGWEGDVLVRQYTWWSSADQVKVVVEYREPVPSGYIEDDLAGLRAFEDRAADSFRILRKELGDALPAGVEKAQSNRARISFRLLSDVLGEVNPGTIARSGDL